ncbi:MAG: hypothetical protein JNL08_21775 [Planctomycetes bacterium]|nr:hypothetical protein [Planctomycetota bacterium]
MIRSNEEGPEGDISETLAQVRAADGNPSALGEVLERYGCRVRAWLRDAGVKNAADLDELGQDVCLRLLQGLRGKRFSTVADFRGFVQTICKNLAIDKHRKRQRSPIVRNRESLGAATGVSLEPRARDRSPLTKAVIGELEVRDGAKKRERDARIATLAQLDQELIRLREVENRTFVEIAQIYTARFGEVFTADRVRQRYGKLLRKVGPPAR